ncbi:MAG: hypothetical protein NVS2B14_14840 [Chamaesiphon sp.]
MPLTGSLLGQVVPFGATPAFPDVVVVVVVVLFSEEVELGEDVVVAVEVEVLVVVAADDDSEVDVLGELPASLPPPLQLESPKTANSTRAVVH